MADDLDEVRRRLAALPDPSVLLEAIFAFSPFGLQIYEASGRSVLTNHAFREMFGSEPPPEYCVFKDEVVGRLGILDLIRRAFAGETISIPAVWYDPRELEHVTVTEGRRVAVSSHFFPLRDRQGKVTHVAIFFEDQTSEVLLRERAEAERTAAAAEIARLYREGETARFEAEAQRERLHAVFLQAPLGIAIQRGPEHVYELANPRYRALFGGRSLVGLPRRDVLPDEATLSGVLDAVYRTGAPFEGKEMSLRIDRRGEGFVDRGWFDFVCQPFRDAAGVVAGVITFGLEITEQVEARRQVEALAGRLGQAVQARDEFLSIASHELKTPLTSLQLQVQSLRRSADRGDPLTAEMVADKAAAGERQIARLTTLINSLLDVSRITGKRLDLDRERVDLAALAAEVVARFSIDLEAAGCAVSVTTSGPVWGTWDRARLDQVLTNLLTNAMKYGRGKPIDVEVAADDEKARCVVRDRGIGVAAADQARIFDRFERAVSPRQYGGFGMGLWIVRQIVQAHGGTIRLESVPGQGATFVVELPRGRGTIEA